MHTLYTAAYESGYRKRGLFALGVSSESTLSLVDAYCEMKPLLLIVRYGTMAGQSFIKVIFPLHIDNSFLGILKENGWQVGL